jgi:cytochrome c peroxidase
VSRRATRERARPAAPLIVAPLALAALALATGCGGGGAGGGDRGAGGSGGGPPPARTQQPHSAALAATPDGTTLAVVHPDADSLTLIDVATRAIRHDVLLAAARPAVDASGRYTPAVMPRAVALDSAGATAYVTGQRSGAVYAVKVASGAITGQAQVCSEPVGVVVSADDATLFVACAQDDAIAAIDAATLAVVATTPCPRKPWSLAWGGDGETLFATHFLGPGVSRLGTRPLSLSATIPVAAGPAVAGADGPPDPTEPHGEARGLYDAAVRPGTGELWVVQLMLGIDTPQPALDFQRTVFPAVSILDGAGGAALARLSVATNPGDGGAFGDVVSGPRAVAFSSDGSFAAVADAASEDLLIIDAGRRVEAALVRPLPGHMPDGVVWLADTIFVAQRNSEDVAAFKVTRGAAGLTVRADGPAIPSLAVDPMPANLRLGQHLFHSANSDELPVTQNHWVACASCHLEGRSDAVTWRFAQGPRDTPSNAGGLLDTGFLFRTADRSQVQDYWKTIDVEQGGHFGLDQPSQRPLLDALAAYVNQAIPSPVPPSTDAAHTIDGAALAALRGQGQAVFQRVGCAACHSGPAYTDSGAGNPQLDVGGPVVSEPAAGGVLLHDVGTCVTAGDWIDVAHDDKNGDPRDACAFDTPQLRGLADSAPYLHDGSAATLDDAVTIMLGAGAPGEATTPLSAEDRRALVEFLRGL